MGIRLHFKYNLHTIRMTLGVRMYGNSIRRIEPESTQIRSAKFVYWISVEVLNGLSTELHLPQLLEMKSDCFY